ncbi:helix-turn-helix domain-containing protein [Salinithrix halophila]|uniref:Helix-turn-helix domain-containing protein n=1 Tax=Salinithrix halophila TaxID=1485204 RepID=A0ABV8JJ47_9BACL
MPKLLIADRDGKERSGLEWLIQSYPLPYEEVLAAQDTESLIAELERKTPEVVCLELDLVPPEQWEEVKRVVRRYAQMVVGMTAEATFERASQAIELHATDLWVKPLSPDRVKRTLRRYSRELAETERTEPATPASSPSVGYRSLFMDQPAGRSAGTLMLAQPEKEERLPALVSFLETYPFSRQPIILPLSQAVACIFPLLEQGGEKALQLEGNRLLEAWDELASDGLTMALHPTDFPLPLHKQYLAAKEALEWRFFQGTRQVIPVAEPVHWKPIDPFLTPEEQREWITMLEKGDRERIREWMHHSFFKAGPPYPEPGRLRIRLTSILAQIRRYMKTRELHRDPSFEMRYHEIFHSILHGPVLYRIVQDLLLFVSTLLDTTASSNQVALSDPATNAVQFMENHYTDPRLSLEAVARHIGRNASYLSHLLSREKGKPYRELLVDIRLRHAKKFLETTSLPIGQVAARTGFSDANYFSRIFKRQTGLSPRAYRDQKKRQKPK